MQLTIKRLSDCKYGTFGVIGLDGHFMFWTLERKWLNNRKNFSCIPPGTYPCTPYYSKKYGNTWIVNDVPNRSGILFHKGNWIKDSKGCILLGRSCSHSMVSESKSAMKEFMLLTKDQKELTLRIEGV